MKVRLGPAGVPHVLPGFNAHVEAHKHFFANACLEKFKKRSKGLRTFTSTALKIKKCLLVKQTKHHQWAHHTVCAFMSEDVLYDHMGVEESFILLIPLFCD